MLDPAAERMHSCIVLARRCVHNARMHAEANQYLDGWASDLFLLETELERLSVRKPSGKVPNSPPLGGTISTAMYRNAL